jgi:fructokinase
VKETRQLQAISIGEVLWDIVGDQEHLGGAPLNFAVHLGRLGHQLDFVSAVGTDRRGQEALAQMQRLGLSTHYVRQLSAYPTGTASVSLHGFGQPRFIINHPAAYDFAVLSPEQATQLTSSSPNLIYFGTLFQMSRAARALTLQVIDSCPTAVRFYDVNLRPDSYELALVQELMSQADVVKMNEEEVRVIGEIFGAPPDPLEQFCRACAMKYGWKALCVTRGAEGCAILKEDKFVESKGYKVPVADTIGAGDAFAAAFAHGLISGWETGAIADFANRVGALVASRAGATPDWTLDEAAALTS